MGSLQGQCLHLLAGMAVIKCLANSACRCSQYRAVYRGQESHQQYGQAGSTANNPSTACRCKLTNFGKQRGDCPEHNESPHAERFAHPHRATIRAIRCDSAVGSSQHA